jgi:hypothetical protein
MRLLPNLILFVSYISTALSQSFLSFDVSPATQIEWDQNPYTYYTGQTINTTWTSQGFQTADLARITYPGAGGTRTLTTGSGTSIASGLYAVRLSDSSNGLATNVALTLAFSTTTSINRLSNQSINVIQSRVTTIVPLDGNRTLGGGQNTVCDDRSLTVQWRGLGQAQFGVASITLRRQSGFTGTQTLASLSNQAVSGNVSFSLVCPRTTTPSGSNSYAFEISVQEPGGNAYTGTSASFNVATAPTPSPTSSPTPTSSRTPSPSPSQTPSPTASVSATPTPTPSETPTSSLTPSTTPTADPSIDYAGLARAAAESVDTTTPAIAGALGGIGGILVLIGAVKWYQQREMTKRRLKKLQMTSRFVQESNTTYGIHSSSDDSPSQPSIVMYTVQSMPQRKTDSNSLTSIKKGFTPKPVGSK